MCPSPTRCTCRSTSSWTRRDRYLGSVTIPAAWLPARSYTQNATFTLPAGLAGTYYVFVVDNSNRRRLRGETRRTA